MLDSQKLIQFFYCISIVLENFEDASLSETCCLFVVLCNCLILSDQNILAVPTDMNEIPTHSTMDIPAKLGFQSNTKESKLPKIPITKRKLQDVSATFFKSREYPIAEIERNNKAKPT